MKKILTLLLLGLFLISFASAFNLEEDNRFNFPSNDLGDLDDVNILSPQDQQVILFNQSSNSWYNSYTNGSNVTVNANHSNSSDYWLTDAGALGTINETQMSNNGGVLNILESFIESISSNPFDQSLNTTDSPTFNNVTASEIGLKNITISELSGGEFSSIYLNSLGYLILNMNGNGEFFTFRDSGILDLQGNILLNGGGISTFANGLILNGGLNMGNDRIVNVGEPVLDNDSATKKYHDDNSGVIVWERNGTTLSPITDGDDVSVNNAELQEFNIKKIASNSQTNLTDQVMSIGELGDAVNGDGSPEYIDTNLGGSMDHNSISFWANMDSGNSQVLFGTTQGNRIYVGRNGGGKIGMGWDNSGYDTAPVGGTATSGWHHWFIDMNVTQGKLYVDNVLQVTKIIGDNTLTGIDYFLLAQNNAGSAGNYANGRVDEFIVWERHLTAGERGDLYNAGVGTYVTQDKNFPSSGVSMGVDIVGIWHIDDGTGSSVADATGISGSMTMRNMEEADWVEGHIIKDGLPQNITVLQSRDAISAGELGAVELGDDDVRNTINGKTIRFNIDSVEAGRINESGNMILTNNLSLGGQLIFGLGEILDNLIEGWIRVNGNLNVTNNLTVVGVATLGNGSMLEANSTIINDDDIVNKKYHDDNDEGNSSFNQSLTNVLYRGFSNNTFNNSLSLSSPNDKVVNFEKLDSSSLFILNNSVLASGGLGKAVNGDGSPEYINFNLNENSAHKGFSMWVQLDAGSGQIFFGMQSGNRLYIGETTGSKYGLGWAGSSYNSAPVSSNSVDTGWHHIYLDRQTSTGKLYIDGILRVTKSGSNNPGAISHFGLSGNIAGSPTNNANGRMDEVVVFNRTLTTDEISDLADEMYVTMDKLFPSTSARMGDSIVALWHMDEGTGSSLADASGISGSATMVSMEEADWVDGIIVIDGSPNNITILKSQDGVEDNENGKVELGSDDVGLTLNGKTIRFNIDSVEVGQINNSGNLGLINNISASYFIGDGSLLSNLPNPFDQSLNTTDSPTFAGLTMTRNLSMNNNSIINLSNLEMDRQILIEFNDSNFENSSINIINHNEFGISSQKWENSRGEEMFMGIWGYNLSQFALPDDLGPNDSVMGIAGDGVLILSTLSNRDIVLGSSPNGSIPDIEFFVKVRADIKGLEIQGNKFIRPVQTDGVQTMVFESNVGADEGEITFCFVGTDTENKSIVQSCSQIGKNNSASIQGMNSQIVASKDFLTMPDDVKAEFENNTGDPIIEEWFTNITSCLVYEEYLQGFGFLDEGLQNFCDSVGNIVPQSILGDLEVVSSTTSHESLTAFNAFEFIGRNGNDVNMLFNGGIENGKLHIRDKRQIEANISFFSQVITNFDDATITPFISESIAPEVGRDWDSVLESQCHQDRCGNSKGGSEKVMAFSAATSFLGGTVGSSNTRLMFWITSLLSGADTFEVELDDNEGNVSIIYNATTTLVDQFINVSFPLAFENKSNVTTRFVLNGQNIGREVWVDIIEVTSEPAEAIIINESYDGGKIVLGEDRGSLSCLIEAAKRINNNTFEIEDVINIGSAGCAVNIVGNVTFTDLTVVNQTVIGNQLITGDLTVDGNTTSDFYFLGNGAYIGYNSTCQMIFYNSTGGVMSTLGCT